MVKKDQLKGISKVTGKLEFCKPCVLGRMKKLPFRLQAHQKTSVSFELMHTDLKRPITPKTPFGFRYWITFVDDFTCYPWVFFLKEKSKDFYTHQANVQ
jgi:hypothetical protein